LLCSRRMFRHKSQKAHSVRSSKGTSWCGKPYEIRASLIAFQKERCRAVSRNFRPNARPGEPTSPAAKAAVRLRRTRTALIRLLRRPCRCDQRYAGTEYKPILMRLDSNGFRVPFLVEQWAVARIAFTRLSYCPRQSLRVGFIPQIGTNLVLTPARVKF
jgi:hypothetical protein